MVDLEAVRKAVGGLRDPELRRTLEDLHMVEGVEADGDRVTVKVKLTTKSCPLQGQIEGMVKERLAGMPGVGQVVVQLSEMDPQERANLFNGTVQKAPILAPESRTQIIAVASGKGGVGKSTVTANLAVTLARMGYEVGLLDADIYGFSIPRMFLLSGRQPTAIDNKILPMVAHDVKVISMGNFVEEGTPVIWRGPMLGKILNQFVGDVLWGEPDYLLVDLPPGTGDMALDVARLMPKAGLVIVTTPQTVASGVASRAAHMARKSEQRLVGIVENMSTFICPHCGEATAFFGEGGGEFLAKQLAVPLLAQIPMTLSIRQGGDAGKPAALTDPVIGEVFEDLARKLVTEMQGQEARSGTAGR
ncbi:Mrp/NBP35 family ATP-binding protein [Limnochorda pilosa]|uniref:Iron-sulfur cluster carrier protein n=1 Tax=Limnochorda pilosa TaxID=1555112 RepID=A0A0K2SNN6_LIMPI|nr:Mrp/NBP35 family ATP-binding protein [Limnochorda pilosa]BAS28622.1 ATP-binding protein [Limnochorda pilosa]